MKRNQSGMKRTELLDVLSHLPKKIMSLHGVEQTPEFVLHELCHVNGFGLDKAAFFVDNPDFNFLRGVAGFSSDSAFAKSNIWDEPAAFVEHMRSMSFNQKVRGQAHESFKRSGDSQEMIRKIAKALDIKNPAHHLWHMKHDNFGLLLYEDNGTREFEELKEQLNNSLYLLSFCPLF